MDKRPPEENRPADDRAGAKKPYEPPRLTTYGNVTSLTGGTNTNKGDLAGLSIP